MKILSYLFIAICTATLGLLFYLWYHQLLIVSYMPYSQTYTSSSAAKTKATLHYWTHNKWVSETVELVSNNRSQFLTLLLNKWCSLAYEEHCFTKQCNVTHTLLTFCDKELYINFNRKPFDKKQSTFEKWMLIEGLLKTIATNSSSITQVNFFVNHIPLQDEHLDFSKPWPLHGFKS
jgi:hypothetical protein